ncbi:MAG: DUF2062 domain-containing protein [Ardenticatenaceae bacterium]|nr:DUF2062 domain-containing protein [Ardenticatenaceae bacterium]MCB9445047.1 DUF2062 domain-containing protein [Ardenticatenaceae bacterium]
MVYETQLSRFSFNRLPEMLKTHWQELIQLDASAQNIALAFAVGTFISVLPIPGIDLALVTLLASLFKQLNRTAMIAALAVWNTFVVAPIYVLSHKVGASLPLLADKNLVIGFLAGNLLLAVVITAVSYLIVQASIERYQLRYSLIKR